MSKTITPAAVFAIALSALPAGAEPTCTVTVYYWDLQLTQVESLSGDPDLQAVANALGARARLRGGFLNPAHPNEPVRVELTGSEEGAGLAVTLERAP